MFKVIPLEGIIFTNDDTSLFPFLKFLFRICFQEEPFWLCSNWIAFREIFSLYRMCTVVENDYFLHINEINFPFSVIVFLCQFQRTVLLMYLYVKMKLMRFHCITQSNLTNKTSKKQIGFIHSVVNGPKYLTLSHETSVILVNIFQKLKEMNSTTKYLVFHLISKF